MSNFCIDKTDLDQIFEHALGEYPFECCGIITGPEANEGNRIVYRCINIQNSLHEGNPEEHPRDARTAYYIDPDELLKILKVTREKSHSIKAFYHSHTENKAYFSEEDKKRALFYGEPTYPGVKYIVVSVIDGKVNEVKIYFWNEKKKDFREENLG